MNGRTTRATSSLLCAACVITAWTSLSAAAWAQPLVSVADVFKVAAPSVGRLVVLDAKGAVAGTASAFVVGETGLVVTNYHCLVDEEDGWAAHVAKVELPGRPPYVADGVVAFSRERDWAILKVPGSGLRPIPLGDASKMEKGEPVVAVGYPVGLDARPTSGTFSGWLEGEILHDASTSSGNSGGSLLDRTGKAIGITRGELRSTSGMVTVNDLYFAVDIKHVQAALSQRTSALTRLPLALPEKAKAAASGGEVAGRVRVGERCSGPGKAIVLGVLGAGALAGGTIALTNKAMESATDHGEVARFNGSVSACSVQTHQFQLREKASVTVDLRTSTISAQLYGFLGSCGGEPTFANGEKGQPGCGWASILTQLGGCTPVKGGGIVLFLNDLPSGSHTLAVHNNGNTAAPYEIIVTTMR